MTANKSKQELRRHILQQRRSLSSDWIACASAAMTEMVTAWEPYRSAKTVMLYLAMADEPQLDDLIAQAKDEGKRVCIPAMTSVRGIMEGAVITKDSPFLTGAFGLRVPDLTRCEIADPASIDLVLVPGVVFDDEGNRIGMGAGYYDRFLTRTIAAVKAGIVWNLQVLPSLTREDHDIPVEYLITERGIRSCSRGKS